MLSLLTHSKPQDRGEVSEWFKEAVLKTVELLPGSVGSNPTLSVSAKATGKLSVAFLYSKNRPYTLNLSLKIAIAESYAPMI